MKPLQRYNIDTVFERTWNNDGWEERLQIEESDNGDWVKWEDVKRLEQQNQKMFEALNKLIDVTDNAIPMDFMKELGGVVGHCKQVLDELKGDGHEITE
jgi:hypothetical protein